MSLIIRYPLQYNPAINWFFADLQHLPLANRAMRDFFPGEKCCKVWAAAVQADLARVFKIKGLWPFIAPGEGGLPAGADLRAE